MSALSAIIGTSTVIRHVQHLVVRVADLDAPVLITGEPGTGKELVARAIHEKSGRASQPFVPVKCGAISEDVLEAELFGHEIGAFAGANQPRAGRLEVAQGGTLYLDEVSRLSPRIQAKIMKFLLEGVYEPVGGDRQISVNVRIIASTTVAIDQSVRERTFREDLYYRFASCSIYIPPISERREDIPPLINHFIAKFNRSRGKRITHVSSDAIAALIQYSWPSNVREIENLIERIVTLKTSGSIDVCDLPPRLRNLVTDNIDTFYEKSPGHQNGGRVPQSAQPTGQQNSNRPPQLSGTLNQVSRNGNVPPPQMMNYQVSSSLSKQGNNGLMGQLPAHYSQHGGSLGGYSSGTGSPGGLDDLSEIEQFIKKEIDLGGGIDFYRVVEEFENRLIAEALRRTNHNKNRAAQLLSMNRTTLVEKLKKRAASNPVKVESGKVKRNSAFTIFDGLGSEPGKFDSIDFMTISNLGLDDDLADRDS